MNLFKSYTWEDHIVWSQVCVSFINCPPGLVNLYDRLFNNIIENEVEEQVKSLFGGNFQGITNVPVQWQLNGSDCGVFAVSFATCLVYSSNPQDFMFHIPQMRPHLLQCLKAGEMRLFSHFGNLLKNGYCWNTNYSQECYFYF